MSGSAGKLAKEHPRAILSFLLSNLGNLKFIDIRITSNINRIIFLIVHIFRYYLGFLLFIIKSVILYSMSN